MRAWIPVVALMTLGCQTESGIRTPFDAFGEANPKQLETPIQIDRVTQVTIPSVDVLFVVDNSCSMEEEQLALGNNFPAFLGWFLGSGLDYHVGVVSTDMNDPLHAGALREVRSTRWVDDTTEAPDEVFDEMVQMGVDGHWLEKGRAAAYSAIEVLKDDVNTGFIRDNAGLHITVVSDEDDNSGDSPVSRDEFVDYLNTARWSQSLVSFSSIVGPTTGCPYIGEPGSDYLAVTSRVGGVTWPICSDDWVSVLDELGFLAVGLKREFFLSRLPVPGTVGVTVENADGVILAFDEGEDWVYLEGRNSIEFVEYLPDPLDVVIIEYQVLASQEQVDEFGSDGPTRE
jgi:hypothetical protein